MKTPLLRGTLIELFPWHDNPARPGWQHRTAQIAVWCPYCQTFHFHGWDPADNGRVISHRAAHCSPDSPLHERGYYISVWRQTDPESVAHVAKPGVPIERICKSRPHELSRSTKPYSPP